MEAPFPALGKTIIVKNFLPGSGTEVSCQRLVFPLRRTGGLASQVPVAGEAMSFSRASSSVVSLVTPHKLHPQSPVSPAQAWPQGATHKSHGVQHAVLWRRALCFRGFFRSP